jgi:hypothetical protein
MRTRCNPRSVLAGVLGALALAACVPAPAVAPEISPRARPAALVVPATPPSKAKPSADSLALSRYYARVQTGLLSQGLLRGDGGGPDTPFSSTLVARNFEQIAFYDEYARGGGLRSSDGASGHLRRWRIPVRMAVEFGASVDLAQRNRDSAYVANFANRLARVSGHPISMSPASPNFHILVMGEDDRGAMLARVQQLAPSLGAASMGIFRNVPRSIHCLVVAFAGSSNDHDYVKAIALVRAEHPDLLRRSCFHEELAQGLGLANDSPQARPSIFNDDDEFALLTTHDEVLLRILYDPRLAAGMGATQAMPIVRRIADELVGGPS